MDSKKPVYRPIGQSVLAVSKSGIDERMQNIDLSFHKLSSLLVLHDKQCEVCECLDQYGEVGWSFYREVTWCEDIWLAWLLSTSNMPHCYRALEFCWYEVIIDVDLQIWILVGLGGKWIRLLKGEMLMEEQYLYHSWWSCLLFETTTQISIGDRSMETFQLISWSYRNLDFRLALRLF